MKFLSATPTATPTHFFFFTYRLKEQKERGSLHCYDCALLNYKKLKHSDSPNSLSMIQQSLRYAMSKQLNPILLLSLTNFMMNN